MQAMRALCVLLALGAASATAEQANPLSKVIELMDSLTAKVSAEAEAADKAYHEYFEWCDDAVKELQYEIKTKTMEKEKLEAKITELTATISDSEVKIEELAASIATSTEEMKNATLIREKENSDFTASEGELVDAIDVLTRAINVLEREMQKNPAAFAQVDGKNMQAVLSSLSTVIEAAGFTGSDKSKLVALVQQQNQDADSEEDEDEQPNAPAPAAYKSHSGSIVEVLEDMKEKAEEELSDLRKAESNARHNYDMLKQSLTDKIEYDTKEQDEAKSIKAESEEAKGTAEGDLEVTVKGLKAAEDSLASTQHTCVQVAADHEASIRSRTEELTAIATAKKILEETAHAAEGKTYSLLQVSAKSAVRMLTRVDLANNEVVSIVKKLANEHHSAALAQLASRISAVVRYGSSAGEDPFVKVRGLITDMIAKLEKEAAEEADEKAYCDDEMAKTEEKKDELSDDVAKLTSKIDQAAAKSAQLKEEVKTLQEELAALAKRQAEMDKARQDEHAAYVEDKADLELGLSGVRKALTVLRDYYANDSEPASEAALLQDDAQFEQQMKQPEPPVMHKKASGAGGGIIDILEVVESDFAKNLATTETNEEEAAAEYEKQTQENELLKTTKEADVKYKTQEFKGLDKTIVELTSDRDTANTELEAVLEYYKKLTDRCVAKPETYEERKKRRDAEIAGLKEALEILENETAFMQKSHRGSRRNLRASFA